MQAMKSNVIGIDIGGTKIRAGVVGCDGRLKSPSISIPTDAGMPKERIVGSLLQLIHSVADGRDACGIGIGSTGPLDNEKGMILDANNIPSLNYFNITECLEGEFGLPATLENDANAMILGEAMYGVAKGIRTVLGLTLGTGLGCALINGCKAWQGVTFSAGEIWTAPYEDGMIEDYASGKAISKRYFKITGKHLPAADIAGLARAGDMDAWKVWNDFSDALACALAWCVDICDPGTVVLGGSVTKSADLFLARTTSLLKTRICTNTYKTLSINIASLGDDGGVIGAAASYLSRRKNL